MSAVGMGDGLQSTQTAVEMGDGLQSTHCSRSVPYKADGQQTELPGHHGHKREKTKTARNARLLNNLIRALQQ